MKFTIGAANLRVLANAIQCLGKVGKELLIEADADCFVLRTLNDAKTAFVKFQFRPAFFERYSAARAGAAGTLQCKLPVRNIHPVFKSLRGVQQLHMELVEPQAGGGGGGNNDGGNNHDGGGDPAGGRGRKRRRVFTHTLVFTARCKHSMHKRYELTFEDCNILSPVFDRGAARNHVAGRLHLFSDMLDHIHGTEEIKLVPSRGGLSVQSFYMHAEPNAERATLNTAMSISSDEFDTFRCGAAAEGEHEGGDGGGDGGEGEGEGEGAGGITFNLREFKAMLAFCNAGGVDVGEVELVFDVPGHPFLLSTAVDQDDAADDDAIGGGGGHGGDGFGRPQEAFAAELVMATLRPQGDGDGDGDGGDGDGGDGDGGDDGSGRQRRVGAKRPKVPAWLQKERDRFGDHPHAAAAYS